MPTALNPHFNAFQGSYSRDRAAGVYDQMQAKSAVMVNDPEGLRFVLARGGVPIYRTRAPQDDDIDAHLEPVEYATTAHWQAIEAERDIPGAANQTRIHLGNELGSTEPKRLDHWMSVSIPLVTSFHRLAVICNWSIFNPDDGVIDRLPKTRAALGENGGEMAFHEGGLVTPRGDIIRTVKDAIAKGAIGGYRKMRDKYGFRVRITEFAASLTPHDGYSQWMSDEEFAQFCDDAAQFYAADGVEAHIFSATGWNLGRGFEYADKPKLLSKFAQTNERNPVMSNTTIPAPSANGVRGVVVSFPPGVQYRNLRVQPQASAADVGDLKVNDEVVMYASPQAPDWRYIERAADGVTGWALWTGVTFIPALSAEALTTLLRYLKAIDEATAGAMEVLDVAGIPF